MWKQQKVASTYVCVRVTGESIERFLNMCRHRNIIFWDISKKEDGIEGNITRTDFLKLKEVCRKTKTRVRIKKKHGLKFLLFRYRKHYAFAIGVLIACAMLYSCSLFIWNVSFTGNSQYTDSALMKYLVSQQIHPGIRIKDIDCDVIESDLRSEYDDITWVSAEIRGTRLIVHIKENDGAKDTAEAVADQRDIVATSDGVVASIITRSGTPLVKPGDTVTAGQILVSGIVNVYNDAKEVAGKIYTSADADIYIQTDTVYEDVLMISHDQKVYTGRTIEKQLLYIVNKQVEVGLSFDHYDEADVVTDIQGIQLTENFYLPIKYGKKTYYEYVIEVQDYTQEEAESILNQNLNTYFQKLIQNQVQIVSDSVKINSNGVSFNMQGMITIKAPAYTYASITDTTVEENKEESN